MLRVADNDCFLYNYYNPLFAFDWTRISYSYNVSTRKRKEYPQILKKNICVCLHFFKREKQYVYIVTVFILFLFFCFPLSLQGLKFLFFEDHF